MHQDLYRLTADNLREALGSRDDVSLDLVRGNDDVYKRCLRSPQEYLAVLASDIRKPHSVLTEPALVGFLNDAEAWNLTDVAALLTTAAPGSRLEQLEVVPSQCWPVLAAHDLFRSTVRNVRSYLSTVGPIDDHLAALLVRAGNIEQDEHNDQDQANAVAIEVLNATATIPDARHRIGLVVSMDLRQVIPAAGITPETGVLLALLLKHNLVDDSADTFLHFRSAGWEAIEPAIAQSSGFAEFMSPTLVDGFVAELLAGERVPLPVRDMVVSELAQYVPQDDAAALRAAGLHVLSLQRSLPLDQVCRVAATTHAPDLTSQLLVACTPLPSGQDIASVLAQLGEPYSSLVTRDENEFDVPEDQPHRTLFEKMKSDGVITGLKKRPRKEILVVSLEIS
ncbi:hypothetical protein [Lentzea sp. NPDC092896]|uniref:hypothetical protein n=1 Tax=Lentzea sp. NPDC092896 TaxID=3364127 RepID=UPI003827BBB0